VKDEAYLKRDAEAKYDSVRRKGRTGKRGEGRCDSAFCNFVFVALYFFLLLLSSLRTPLILIIQTHYPFESELSRVFCLIN
jgi:hypothetical protein